MRSQQAGLKPLEQQTCGECLLFNTPKCSFLYSYEVKTEPREIGSWKEFVDWLFTIDNTLLIRTKLVRNTILPTDYACADFIPEEKEQLRNG